MEKSRMTFVFKGPWFTNMHILATVDPANIHHVMSKNFGNYPKGSIFNEIFDILGDGIFNTDSTVWQYHRKMAQSFLGNPKFHEFLIKKTWDKVENGLIPILDHVSKHAIEIDLQDLFARFTFDTICTIVMDHDPISLSIDLPSVPAIKALDDTEEAIFYRHVVPTCVWKFLRWLNVGEENKHRKAWQILDTFIYKYIAMKREELSNGRTPKNKEDTELSTDLLTLYIEQEQNQKVLVDSQGDKFLRDTI
ncbi:hypothetical protein BVRB_6g139180 [Beta vulgaris subsp. vulgaris]|nr:hypothetical protein BVRB_6g139180 [Beta vulgaris subsp. vulgaris]